jgi:hypothetical protein
VSVSTVLAAGIAQSLRRLSFTRFGFAVVWADLYVNVVIGLLAAAASSGIPGVLRMWGSWAIVAGVASGR